jgi:hypothetical protein
MPPSILNTALGDLALIIKTNAETYLVDAGLEVPANSYVTHGSLSWDCCDLLVVTIDQVVKTKRFPSKDNVVHRPVRTAVSMTVYLSRCWPVGNDQYPIPSNQQLEDAALELADYGWVLDQRFSCAVADNSLISGVPFSCDSATYDGITPLGPGGGCAGWKLGVSVEAGT